MTEQQTVQLVHESAVGVGIDLGRHNPPPDTAMGYFIVSVGTQLSKDSRWSRVKAEELFLENKLSKLNIYTYILSHIYVFLSVPL